MNTHTVDIDGAADLLKVHAKTVSELISAGAIPAAQVGRSYVMLTKHVLEYLEQRILAETTQRLRRVTPAANDSKIAGTARAVRRQRVGRKP